MKKSNYRLVVKTINEKNHYYIEEKYKYFFGLFVTWKPHELGTSFKSELEAQNYLKLLEMNYSILSNKEAKTKLIYFNNDDKSFNIVDGL
jgi:hypothetical protein